MQWKWIDEKNQIITFPAEATKNNRPHTFPIGDVAAEILAGLPRIGEFVFPATQDA